MQDAESESPVCGDTYAKVFMNEEGLEIFAAFENDAHPNASNVARARIVDDLLREELAAHLDMLVLTIGAGFDSRPYRLTGGTWVELDEPAVISYKNEQLPVAESPNELHRIPIDFSTESVKEKLSPFAERESPVVIVVEGVFVYLDEPKIRQLLQMLKSVFPQHMLIGDMTSKRFFEEYGHDMHDKLKALGTSFKYTPQDPESIFKENGYLRREKISVVGSAVKFGSITMPPALLETVFRTLADGYSIYVFETGG